MMDLLENSLLNFIDSLASIIESEVFSNSALASSWIKSLRSMLVEYSLLSKEVIYLLPLWTIIKVAFKAYL